MDVSYTNNTPTVLPQSQPETGLLAACRRMDQFSLFMAGKTRKFPATAFCDTVNFVEIQKVVLQAWIALLTNSVEHKVKQKPYSYKLSQGFAFIHLKTPFAEGQSKTAQFALLLFFSFKDGLVVFNIDPIVKLKYPFSKEDIISREFSRRNFLREHNAFHAIGGSPHVALLIASELKENKGIFYQELLDGGELFEHLYGTTPPTPEQKVLWMNEIMAMCRVLHDAKIVHCDFKDSNIFLSHDGHLKLGDFGFSQGMLDPPSHFRGSLLFMPPEQFVLTFLWDKVDLFAAGMVLLTMKDPAIVKRFEFEDHLKRLNEVAKYSGELALSTNPLDQLLVGLLQCNRSRRFTIDQAEAVAALIKPEHFG